MVDFGDIVHPVTIKILKSLFSESKNLSLIATELNISRPEISRQLTKMRKISLVEKEESLNSITSFGSLILEIISPLDFIISHYEFFENHPLINFPSELLYGLNRLQNSILINGTGNIFQKFIEVAASNHQNLKLMFSTPIPNIANVVYEEGSIIVPTQATSPILHRDQLSKVIKIFEIRKLPELNYDIAILNNIFGFLYFSDKFGSPDNNSCFFINDSDGMDFLQSVWNYFWDKSILFKQTKKNIT